MRLPLFMKPLGATAIASGGQRMMSALQSHSSQHIMILPAVARVLHLLKMPVAALHCRIPRLLLLLPRCKFTLRKNLGTPGAQSSFSPVPCMYCNWLCCVLGDNCFKRDCKFDLKKTSKCEKRKTLFHRHARCKTHKPEHKHKETLLRTYKDTTLPAHEVQSKSVTNVEVAHEFKVLL